MNIFVVACVLAMIASSSAGSLKCGEDEHVFNTNCGHLMIEPTCDFPHPKPMDVKICDYESCFCNPPKVRNIDSNKCVTLDKCPTTDFQQFFKEHPELHPELKDKKTA